MLPAILIGVVVWLARSIYLNRSYDVFVDEITYTRLSQHLVDTGRVSLYGEPFYLHPPAFFVMSGMVLIVGGSHAGLIETIFFLRQFNIIVAAITAVGLWAIGRRLAGWRAGALTVLLFGLDPFIIRMNSRVLLETMALCWVVGGYWALFAGLDAQKTQEITPPLTMRGRMGWIWCAEAAPPRTLPNGTVILVGVCFSAALLTKDMTAFLTVLPLGICWIGNWSLSHRMITSLLAMIATCYVMYLVSITTSGEILIFMSQKGRGMARLLGLIQETGLNREVGPSLTATVMARLSQFMTTYVILVLGIPALLVLFWRGGTQHRLLAIWVASAYALLAYCVGLGTLEEQFFYFLVIPVLVALGVVGGPLLKLTSVRAQGQHYRTSASRWIGVGLVTFIIWSSYQWSENHLSPHNGYQELLMYVDQHLRNDERIAATSEAAQFLLGERTSPPWGDWSDPAELASYQPDYLLISIHQLEWDHGSASHVLRDWAKVNGSRVFTFGGQGDGPLELYRLRWQEK